MSTTQVSELQPTLEERVLRIEKAFIKMAEDIKKEEEEKQRKIKAYMEIVKKNLTCSVCGTGVLPPNITEMFEHLKAL